jgi:hypothetical protein
MKKLKKLLSNVPYIWAFPILFLAYFASYPAVDFFNEIITKLVGHEVEISFATFQIVLIGLMVFIASADFSLGGIRFQIPWIFNYYNSKKLCSNDFQSLTPWHRQLLLFLYLALFMVSFALIIAAV